MGTMKRRKNPKKTTVSRSKKRETYGLPAWMTQVGSSLQVSYGTRLGVSLIGLSEQVLSDAIAAGLEGKVKLIFTSPPFPLVRNKRYNNLRGEAYKRWLASYAPLFKRLLTKDGSVVIEMGNVWEAGRPEMSTLPMESLLEFKRAGQFYLCQELIWHNPARLPGPAQWVTVKRVRLKDTFSRVWWMSPSADPQADNRQILIPYSDSMQRLLASKQYNAGRRPSEHTVGRTSFLANNGGAIPPNVVSIEANPDSLIAISNTRTDPDYRAYCARHSIEPHPARMPRALAELFIRLCTKEGDLVVDPFAGSNTTGAAAESLNRQWIAVEASADYAKSGRARFPDHLKHDSA